MTAPVELRKQYFQPYVFSFVADLPAPQGGQLVNITGAPDFGDAHILLLTDGQRTIRELYQAWKDGQVSPQAVMAALTAERQERILADAGQQQQITAVQQGANRALVFDTRAVLDGWMADGQPLPPPNPPYTPEDLRIGWQALFRDEGIPDLWWDGTAWIPQEVHIDLAGYRTAAAQNLIDAAQAPLDSPVFSGIPQVPVPDYSVPLQAVPVGELVYVLEAVRSLLYGTRRIAERGVPLRPVYRETERGGVKRKTERAAV
jgi:hypothetical protein